MEIDGKNVNYLISRCILLENRNSRQDKRIKGFEEYIEVHDHELIEVKNANKLAHERIKELEERVGRIDELTNEVYGEAFDYLTRFTLNNVVYFEDDSGSFMIANDGATDFTVTITHQEYTDALNQYLKQEDPRDYPEELQYE